MDAQTSPVRVERHGAVAVMVIDHAPVNALSKGVRLGLRDAVAQLGADPQVAAIVLSGGPGRFVAGADIREMSLQPEEPHVPDILAAIDALDKPVVAAIDGAALGGGCEIALACDLRLASPKALVGLTETRLGIIPGAGGTQRLPRLVGIADAIALICESRILKAQEARALGIVDEVVEGDLVAAAVALAPQAAKRRLSEGDPAREEAAAAATLKGAKGLPAIAEAVRVVRATRGRSFAEGMADERATFLALRRSAEAEALRHLFFAEREAGKVPGLDGAKARLIKQAAVVGAGTMGAGSAVKLADAGYGVTLVERDPEAAEAGLARAASTSGR